MSNPPKLTKKAEVENDFTNKKSKKDGNNEPTADPATKSQGLKSKSSGKRLVKRGATGPGQGSTNAAADRTARQSAAIQKMLAEIEEAEQAQIVKLGDASIAAPFTAKSSSIACVNHVIKHVVTLAFHKIGPKNIMISLVFWIFTNFYRSNSITAYSHILNTSSVNCQIFA